MKKKIFLVFLLICIASAVRISQLRIGAPREHNAVQNGYYDYEGVIHCHTDYTADARGTYEDVAAVANDQKVDFVIPTEHNNLQAFYHHKERWYGDTLMLTGAEMTRQEGYLLALDLHRYPIAKVDLTDGVLAETARQGGIVFIAHPENPRWRWKRAYDARIAGQEILDITDQLNMGPKLSALEALLYYPFNTPAAFIQLYHYPTDTIRRWDGETAQHNFTGIFAPDFHQNLIVASDKLEFRFPKVEDMLPFAHDHIVSATPFIKSFDKDKSTLLEAIRKGHIYVAVDLLQDATGFFFSAKQGDKTAWMGDTLKAGETTDFTVTVPQAPLLRNLVIHAYLNGQEIGRSTHGVFKFQQSAPGAYRVEVEGDVPTFWGGLRTVTWIYSNPVYLR